MMRKDFLIGLIFFCMEFLFPAKSYSCINSNCKPCPIGFSLMFQCCHADGGDCIALSNEIEDCGKGKWHEYPLSVSFHSYSRMECCTDANENNCRSLPNTDDYCGMGEFKKFPYSPVKKCCKNSTQSECFIIRSKGYCGEYQFKEYPLQTSQCCNSILSKCIKVKDCPKCL